MWDWVFLARCEYVCFAVVKECDAEEGERDPFGLCQVIGLKVMKAATRYLVEKTREKGLMTEMEMMVDDYWHDLQNGGVPISMMGGTPRGSGNGGSKAYFVCLTSMIRTIRYRHRPGDVIECLSCRG